MTRMSDDDMRAARQGLETAERVHELVTEGGDRLIALTKWMDHDRARLLAELEEMTYERNCLAKRLMFLREVINRRIWNPDDKGCTCDDREPDPLDATPPGEPSGRRV